MAKRGQRPRRSFPLAWAPELAYACGLIATDGCLMLDGRHLNLTSNDLDQLETFKKCLGLKCKVSWKPSGFTKRLGSQVQFGDVVLYKWLLSIGFTPRKTKTIGEIIIPDKFFFDYLRGEFDGDGSSHAYWDTRWRSSVSIYISFVCASKKHLTWINQTVERLINVSGCVRQNRSIYQLKFSKQKAYKVYKAMYYSDTVPFLKRKKDKLDRQWAANSMAKTGKWPMQLIRGGPILRIA